MRLYEFDDEIEKACLHFPKQRRIKLACVSKPSFDLASKLAMTEWRSRYGFPRFNVANPSGAADRDIGQKRCD